VDAVPRSINSDDTFSVSQWRPSNRSVHRQQYRFCGGETSLLLLSTQPGCPWSLEYVESECRSMHVPLLKQLWRKEHQWLLLGTTRLTTDTSVCVVVTWEDVSDSSPSVSEQGTTRNLRRMSKYTASKFKFEKKRFYKCPMYFGLGGWKLCKYDKKCKGSDKKENWVPYLWTCTWQRAKMNTISIKFIFDDGVQYQDLYTVRHKFQIISFEQVHRTYLPWYHNHALRGSARSGQIQGFR